MTKLYAPEGKLTLTTLLGDYPKTAAMREGRIASDIVSLDVSDITQAPKGFKPLVRDLAFDVAEVSIITALQARQAGKPYALLPLVINGRFHHSSLIVRTDRGIDHPSDLAGKRIGMRMYAQTTPTWVRGFLQNDFGVDLSGVQWVTFEAPHVAECPDPASVMRAEEGKTLNQMLLDGELDAAFTPFAFADDPRVKPMFADPAAQGAAWSAAHGGAAPINHMMVVREELLAQRPDAVREIARMVIAARAAMDPPMAPAVAAMQPFGLEPLRKALEIACLYAQQQGLTRECYAVDDLFDDMTRTLGSDQ